MWAPKSTRQIHGVDLHVLMGEGGAQNLAKRSKTLHGKPIWQSMFQELRSRLNKSENRKRIEWRQQHGIHSHMYCFTSPPNP